MPILRRRFLTGAGALAAAQAGAKPAAAAQFSFKLGFDIPASHPIGVAANEFAAAVRRESNGRLDISVFPDNILGGDPAMVSQLRVGAIQMSLQASAPLGEIVPITGITVVGFALEQTRDAIAALDGDLGEMIRRDLEAKGLVAFRRTWEAGFRQLTSGLRPIRTADDLASFRLRVPPAAITVDMWKTLGASPVPLATNELYPALQTHIVDGSDGPYINLLYQRIYEVQRYLSVTNHQWSGYWLVINGDAWRSLPPDLQAIVERNADLAAARETRIATAQNNAVSDLLVRYGMHLNVAAVDTFRSRLGSYYARWRREFGPKAWAALEKYAGKLG